MTSPAPISTAWPLIAAPLTAEAFSAYGQVIEIPEAGGRTVNTGTARRHDELAALELSGAGGAPTVSLFRARPAVLPFRVRGLERHPLSSQLFMPLARVPFLVVVAAVPHAKALRAFLTSGQQGVNYNRGIWHHPLIALEEESDFLMLGRRGPGNDCELADLQEEVIVSVLEGANTSSISR